MQVERREYETADGKAATGQRLVKLPGSTSHTTTRDSAKVIARRLSIAKTEKRLTGLSNG